MKKKFINYVPATECFAEMLKNISPNFSHDEIKIDKFARFYRAVFNCWRKDDPELKMEITITKKTQEDLEKHVIEFLS